MPVLFGMPEGISDDLEHALLALQTSAGKQEGQGKWIDVVKDGSGIAGYLRIDGTGNSWAVGTATSNAGMSLAYTLLGDTMTLTWFLLNTGLTVATATTFLLIKLPDGFRTANRNVTTAGRMINGGTALGTRNFVSPSNPDWVQIEKISAAAITTDTAFTVEGSITFEVQRL